MIGYFNRITLVAALAVAGGGQLVADRAQRADRGGVRNDGPRHEADYFIENFTATTMDAQGRRKLRPERGAAGTLSGR
ncbi:MAG: hypothetical protein MZW92_09595 [Comamonadaceae bacterium]|nr:hypothetical protein [Comamonadaceae bacterium]